MLLRPPETSLSRTKSRKTILVRLYPHAPFLDQEADIEDVFHGLTERPRVDDELKQGDTAGVADVILSQEIPTTLCCEKLLLVSEAGLFDSFHGGVNFLA